MENEKTSWRDRIKTRFQDREFADDEELGGAGADLLDELSSEREVAKAANQKLIDIFNSEPAVADFIADIMNGSPVEIAIVKNFDTEALTPQEGEPNYEDWAANKASRSEKMATAKKMEEEILANKIESSKAFDDFVAAKGWAPEQADTFMDKIDAFLADLYRGKVTQDFLETMLKSTNYEADIEAAKTAALVEGKNATIVAEKTKKPVGDGLPMVTGTSTKAVVAPKQNTIIDRAVANSQDRKRF